MADDSNPPTVRLRFRTSNSRRTVVRVGRRRLQDRRQVDAGRLPVVDGRVELEQVGPADDLVEGAQAEAGHDLPGLFGHQEEVIHDVFGGAFEAAP
jgi:hypothetical protein